MFFVLELELIRSAGRLLAGWDAPFGCQATVCALDRDRSSVRLDTEKLVAIVVFAIVVLRGELTPALRLILVIVLTLQAAKDQGSLKASCAKLRHFARVLGTSHI